MTPYIIPIGRLAITNFCTSFHFLLQVGGSPSSMSNPSNNSPTLIQLGLSNNTTPIKFQEKEIKKIKKIKTAKAKIYKSSQIYDFNLCQEIWRRNMDLQSK